MTGHTNRVVGLLSGSLKPPWPQTTTRIFTSQTCQQNCFSFVVRLLRCGSCFLLLAWPGDKGNMRQRMKSACSKVRTDIFVHVLYDFTLSMQVLHGAIRHLHPTEVTYRGENKDTVRGQNSRLRCPPSLVGPVSKSLRLSQVFRAARQKFWPKCRCVIFRQRSCLKRTSLDSPTMPPSKSASRSQPACA
jgi:hypothetical protein